MSKILELIKDHPARYWILAFVFSQILIWHDGGYNTASRFAALRAMSEMGTFNINEYTDWTKDWSQTPDGNYYSNKAPGPVLLALPFAAILDRLIYPLEKSRLVSKKGILRLPPPRRAYKTFLSVLLQVIPFSLLVAICLKELVRTGTSLNAIQFSAIAAFFGNTSVFFMNSFFGHGLASVFLLSFVYASLKKNSFWMGMALGWALLTDYGVAVLLPALAIILYQTIKIANPETRKTHLFLQFLLGGILPAALWILYHTSCFGSPISIGPQYYNPAFVDPGASKGEISGILSLLPNLTHLAELIAGSSRGILWTQPWMLVVFPFCVLAIIQQHHHYSRILLYLSVIGLPLLIYMNASFNGWHGGGSPGPRYLSILFPISTLAAAVVYDRMSKSFRILAWLTLGITILFWIIAFPFEPLASPGESVWLFYLFERGWKNSFWPWIKLGVLTCIFGWALLKTYRSHLFSSEEKIL